MSRGPFRPRFAHHLAWVWSAHQSLAHEQPRTPQRSYLSTSAREVMPLRAITIGARNATAMSITIGFLARARTPPSLFAFAVSAADFALCSARALQAAQSCRSARNVCRFLLLTPMTSAPATSALESSSTEFTSTRGSIPSARARAIRDASRSSSRMATMSSAVSAP